MRPILFIMGGAGNVYYQYNYVNKKHGKKILVSDIFYQRIFKKLLGHTANFPKHKKTFQNANFFIVFFYLIFFIFDLILVKIFKKSFFTYFDSTNIKNKPLLRSLIYFGYFQSNEFLPFNSTINADIFLKSRENKIVNCTEVCVHIRGGDYLAAYEKDILRTNMPLPSVSWYTKALNILLKDNNLANSVNLVTDDIVFSENILKELQSNFDHISFNLISKSFNSDLNTLLNADYMIIHNSTFALMAAESSIYLKKAVISDYMKSKCLSESLVSRSKFLSLN